MNDPETHPVGEKVAGDIAANGRPVSENIANLQAEYAALQRGENPPNDNDLMVALCNRLADHLAAALRAAPDHDVDFLSGYLCGPVFDALGVEHVGWQDVNGLLFEEHATGLDVPVYRLRGGS